MINFPLMKLKHILFLLVILASANTFGQYEITIEASVKDAKTQQGIPFVNIGIKGKAIGTVSEDDGRFELSFIDGLVTSKDTLVISHIGYTTQQIDAKSLFKQLESSKEFFLEPEVNAMPTTVINAAEAKSTVLGRMIADGNTIGYWKDKRGLGGEITTQITVREKNTKLKRFSFNVLENQADSLLVRINVYDIKDNLPYNNLLLGNIYHTIIGEGKQTVDLRNYGIVTDDDVIIGIELLKVYGENIGFAIGGGKGKRSFTKLASQGDWIVKNGIAMAFSVEASVPVSKARKDERTPPKDILVLWDNSMSREKANVQKELELLKSYLSSVKDAKVSVFTFNNEVYKIAENVSGRVAINQLIKSAAIKENLGSSRFPNLESLPQAEVTIIFTDGKTVNKDADIRPNGSLFFINSALEGNHQFMQDLSYIYDGTYVNLAVEDEKEALKYLMTFEQNKLNLNNDASKKVLFSGRVLMDGMPVQNATITVKETLNQVQSNADGRFKIDAAYGDVLDVKFLLAYDKSVTIEDDKALLINLTTKVEALNEVALQGEAEELEDLGFGTKSRDALAFDMRVLDKEDFPRSAIDITDIIRFRFGGVQVLGDRNNPKVVTRRTSSFTQGSDVLFVVDGTPAIGVPTFILPEMISKISFVNSLRGTALYGGAGRNGIFFIETKLTEQYNTPTAINDKLITGNDYEEKVYLLDPNMNVGSEMLQLKNASSKNEAIQQFYKLLPKNINNVVFYVDAADYLKIWDKEFSKRILSTLYEIGQDNVKVLRTYAYKLEEYGDDKTALDIYKRIVALKPNSAQAYFDLASSYKVNGQYQKAFTLYKNMLGDAMEGIDFSGMTDALQSEMFHMLTKYRDKISYQELPNEWLSKTVDIDIRMMFEWNSPQTEFILQFVNPERKYYQWNHTVENKTRIEDELENDFALKEFNIQDSLPGLWLVNIENLDVSADINPAYMKYTLYKNYGKTTETRQVKVLPLFRLEEKVSVDNFRI